jgi:hypothetical protein
MSTDAAAALLQRLFDIASEVERHQAAIYLLEREREERRTELRRVLHAAGKAEAVQ